MTTYYKGNNIGLSYNASAGTWSFNNTPQDFIDPNAFSTPDPKFPTAPTVPDASVPEPPTDPCPPGYMFDKELQQCVPDPNYQNPFRPDNNQGGGNEQPFQPGTGKELPKGVNYNPDSLFPYSTDAPTRAQQNEHMLLQSGISLGWLVDNGKGQYIKSPFNEKQGEGFVGWAGLAIKYFNKKSYDDYFKILENGWNAERDANVWTKWVPRSGSYSLVGGMKYGLTTTGKGGTGSRTVEYYDYSPDFKKKITQAQSITGGMIDRDGNVNINADGKGGYYREDGKFVLNNGQVVSFGSMTAGLNYLANLEGSGLKLSDALRKRLGKALDSDNIDWATLNKSGKSIDYLRDLVKRYKQEKVKTVDKEFLKEDKDDVATGVKEAVDLKDNGSQVQDDYDSGYSDYEQDTTPTGGSGSGSGFSYGTGSSEEYDKFADSSSSSSGASSSSSGVSYTGNEGQGTSQSGGGVANPHTDTGFSGGSTYVGPKAESDRPKCFHPEQLIGNKFIKDLEPGDLINGAKILGMVKLKLDEDMYSLNDVRVTGTHKVKYNNNWMYVSEHPDSFVINDKPEFVYVPIVEGGTFIINNYEFADYDDEHIETLNNKLKVA